MSLRSYSAFVEWCKKDCDEETIVDILRNVHSKKIPASQNFRAKAIQAIKMALRSLFLFLPLMAIECRNKKVVGYPFIFAKLVHKSWCGIWEWVSFLHTHCVVAQSLGETLKVASLHFIPKALESFGWYAGLRRSMITTPGLFAILVSHWVEEDTYVTQPKLEWDQCHFANCLDQLLLYYSSGYKEDGEVVLAITNAVDGGPETVSRVALKQLSARLQYVEDEDSPHLHTVCFNLMVIHRLSSGSSLANLQQLLCQGLAPTIVKFLNILPSKVGCRDDEIPLVIDNCMLATISIVSTILFSANGPAWVSQLIDAGLVPGMLSSGRWLEHIDSTFPSAISTGVFSHLQRYLVYRSVLRSVKKTLKDVRWMKNGQHLAEPLWQQYLVFEKIALNRLELKTMFDKEVALGSDPGHSGCEKRDVSVCIPT
jgi:hypothetical protein